MVKGKPYPSLKDNRNFQRQVEGYVVVQESMSALIKWPLEFPSRKKGKRKQTKKDQLYWVK